MSRVAGFGFRKGAGIDSLLDALMMAGGMTDLSCISTVQAKAEAPCMRALSERLGLPIVAVASDRLVEANVLTVSQKSIDMYGTGSVSEAAALIVAGPAARLVAPRMLSEDRMATCAIARIDPSELENPAGMPEGPTP